MTKKEFMVVYITPYLKADDRPYNRQLFNDTKDSLFKDGIITEKQCDNWVYPENKYFEGR